MKRITFNLLCTPWPKGHGYILLLVASLVSSCATTRTETDYYTITDREYSRFDTTRVPAGSSDDNGITFPSPRTTEITRNTTSHDSTYDRKYPNFLRAGGIEIAGLIGSSSSTGIGGGLFGIFGLFSNPTLIQVATNNIPQASASAVTIAPSGGSNLFKGELIRFEPYEFRLRWFGDAPNWTVGWSAYELLAPSEQGSQWLSSIAANLYLRHRTFIRDRIPYVIFSPFVGIGLVPSGYVNLGGELQVGSLAGINVRAYAGFAGGYKQIWNPSPGLITFPYLGLGLSMMDFTNRPEETEREWKDYVHTGIDLNIIEASLLKTNGDTSIFVDGIPFKGVQFKLASVEIPLPFLNYHFWAGTSLLNCMILSQYQIGLGILPLRVGYRQYIFSEDLMFEPFLEYNYYPSSIVNIGARLKLDTHSNENIGLTMGFASGSPANLIPSTLQNILSTPIATNLLNFNTFYLGVSIFLGDRNYTPEKIREGHATEH